MFPRIPVSGNRAAAGIYAPVLLDNQFISDPRLVICPASRLAEQIAGWRVPTLRELDAASPEQAYIWRRTMGGSYGYTLGYRDGNKCVPTRNELRSYFALMSDAPSLHLEGRRSSNHCGRGQNVLFEDGHVAFLVDLSPGPIRDALFVNRDGFAEAGVDKTDSVIGGSSSPPLIAVH
jgi:hypothetical protein